MNPQDLGNGILKIFGGTILLLSGIFFGSIFLSSYNSRGMNNSNQVLRLVNSELNAEDQSLYQAGYLISYGCSLIIFLFTLPIIFKKKILIQNIRI